MSVVQTIYRANEYLNSMHDAIVKHDRKHDIEIGFGNNHNDFLRLALEG